jgi:hypothetical protein
MAGDAQPFDLQSVRKLERSRLQLAQCLRAFALRRAPAQLRLGEVAEVLQRTCHDPCYAVATVAESSGGLAIVCSTTQ